MTHRRRVFLRSCLTFAAVAVAAAVVQAAPALAANTLYWGDYGNDTLSFANLDNTGGGGQLDTSGVTPSTPWGEALDSAMNKVYWADWNTGTFGAISFASLDGGGGGHLNTTGATVTGPAGVAIDPATNKIYWADYTSNTISFANLDDTGGGGQLNISGAPTPSKPSGVAIDPATNKLYWVNNGNGTISFANLDDTGGGGQLDTTGATLANSFGVAIDPAANKIYSPNCDNNTISFANLDDTGGGGQLDTTGATLNCPEGLAIDHATNKLYTTNFANGTISYANLNDTGGGGQLDTTGATLNKPNYPAILKVPSGTGAPAISAGSTPGSELSCSQGSWAPDLLGSFLYRAPRSYSYSWTLDGHPIAGASSSSITAGSAGQYACQVMATNHAGTTSQTSTAVMVVAKPVEIVAKPVASTGAASSVSAGGAVLNGTVNSEGLAAGYHFDYGTSTVYGSRVPASDATVGSDASDHAVSQSIAGLLPGQSYHFRVVASNADGTSYGADQTFTTRPAVLSRLSVSPRALSIAGRKVHGQCLKPTQKNNSYRHCRRPIKLKVSYTLNAASTITFTLRRQAPGRKVKGRCVKPAHNNRKRTKCTRLVSVQGKILQSGQASATHFTFNGKVGSHQLAPGTYQLTAAPAGGKAQTVRFTIVG